MLTDDELAKSKLFLQQATAATQWVKLAFQLAGNSATAARLNDIGARLADETAAVDRLIAKAGGQTQGSP